MSNDEVKNPFPGLRPFEFGDNHLFFGRDQQTTELTTRLRKNRFVAVVGTSGSGKSSLVRAGLMPELLSGTMAGAGSSWETTIMRPGGDPLTNLAAAIVDADLYDPEEEDIASQVRATLTRSGLGLVEAMRQSELPEGTNFLLVVDQFEEIFRFRRSDDATDEQAAFFVNLLLEASAQADLPLYVIITMRSDFLGECSQFPRLADTVNEGEFLIPRLNRDQRKEAIVGPVKVAGGEITDRLLLRLLNDIGDDPDQLPILQHALMRTWDLFEERGGGGSLDLEHYQATGGMGEALSRHADEVYSELPDDEHKRIAEKLFKSLTEKVDANRGIRRPMQLAELHEICGGEESHLRDVLDSFRKTGCTFLMPAGEVKIKIKTVIDISHESLMRAWRSLRNWVDEEAQSAKIYRRLADTATLYHEDKAGLYRDPDLQISLSWREENRPNKTWADRYYPGFDSAMAFLDQSQEEANREEREREEARQREVAQANALAKARARSAAIFKFACVGVSILALIAIFAMFEARNSRDLAESAILQQAKRIEEKADSLLAQKSGQSSALWLNDAIQLSKPKSNYRKKLIKKLAENFVFSPNLKEKVNLPSDLINISIDADSYTGITESNLFNHKNNKSYKHKLNLSNTLDLFYDPHNKFALIRSKDNLKIYNFIKLDEKILLDNLNSDDDIKVEISNNGKYIAIIKNSVLQLYDFEGYNVIYSKENFNYKKITFSNLGNKLLGYSDDEKALFVYNISVKNIYNISLRGVLNDLSIIESVNYYDGKKELIIVAKDRMNRVIKIKKLNEFNDVIFDLVLNENQIRKIKINKLTQTFGWLSQNGELTIYNGENDTKNIFDSEEGDILDFYLSIDGLFTCSVNTNKSISIFNSFTGEVITKNYLLPAVPGKVVFSDDNLKIVVMDNVNACLYHITIPPFTKLSDAYFPGRYFSMELPLKNTKSYKRYKINFPHRRENLGISSPGFQIAEIGIFGGNEKKIENFELVSNSGGRSPKGESPAQAFDGDYFSKYLNWRGDNSDIIFTLKSSEAVTKLVLTSANDAPWRDPINYEIYGENESTGYDLIQAGGIVNNAYLNTLNKNNTKLSAIIESNKSLSNIIERYLFVSLDKEGNVTIKNTFMNDVIDNDSSVNLISFDWLQNPALLAHWHVKCSEINSLNNNDVGNSLHMNKILKYIDGDQAVDKKIALHQIATGNANKAKTILRPLISENIENLVDYATCLLELSDYNELERLINREFANDRIGSNSFWDTQLIKLALFSPIKLTTNTLSKLPDSAKFADSKTDYNKSESSSYVEINTEDNFIHSSSLTIEAWIKLSKKKPVGFILNKGGEGTRSGVSDGFSITQINYNNIRFEVANNITGERKQFDIKIDSEEWFHYAVTWDSKSGRVNIYINGVAEDKELYIRGPIGYSKQKLNIGRSENWAKYGFDGYWDGSISELRIWNIPLSANLIKKGMNQRVENSRFGLISVWPLNSLKTGFVESVNNDNYNGTNNNLALGETDKLPFSENEKYLKFSANYFGSNSNNLNTFSIANVLRNGSLKLKSKIINSYSINNITGMNQLDYLLLSLLCAEIGKKEQAITLYQKSKLNVTEGGLQGFKEHAWREEIIIQSLIDELQIKLN